MKFALYITLHKIQCVNHFVLTNFYLLNNILIRFFKCSFRNNSNNIYSYNPFKKTEERSCTIFIFLNAIKYDYHLCKINKVNCHVLFSFFINKL
ncbi:hypothetical protein NCER_100325 [Vairimorpha ceranae BRL01]|uniref:Uncharacterized protein n=1 Tax=Vairimorpha ceranae (strain BRL01) TaxID=578460 RepID=C4V7A3_VAIC1|nr:hypothetical protein NCER_100325 [Vairimorpha ceranae BRL01]